ncbi:hypothetical protein BGLA2_2390003 [Burkholderia gladioli]|nr:hypothetical protein BGLA2_2390003 [Burkholderia gladioli]
MRGAPRDAPPRCNPGWRRAGRHPRPRPEPAETGGACRACFLLLHVR